VSHHPSDYSYSLPSELIATRPAADRTGCRLLVLDRESGGVEHTVFARLEDHLEPGDLLCLNDTRVVPARLHGRRPTGGQLELLLVRRLHQAASNDLDTRGAWEVLARPGKRLPVECRFELEGGAIQGTVQRVLDSGRRWVELESADGETPIERLIEELGHMPIPPYLGRRADARDRDDYQTVFARHPGAIAAPTAGLHFSLEQLAVLEQRGIEHASLTLHVGPGTFQPVAADDLRQHRLEGERFILPEQTAQAIVATRARGARVVAVGTTVVRTLEARALASAGADRLAAATGTTDLFIHPPFEFRVVDALLTNFHLPESSLLMLVAAFAGRERILAAYREAILKRYLVYSYGDAMLIV
jgi:S-adenosylmethionine:tRNA ribosyltransferase-isomerase